MAIFECKYIVGLTDVGQSNKITNKAIIKILENAGGMHSEMVGCGLNEIENTKLSWILLNWKVKVIKRVLYNTNLTIKTWARETNRITTYRDFEIYDDVNNLIAIATSKWTLVNIDTKQLAQLPDIFIEKYKPEDKSVFKDKKIKRLLEPQSYMSKIEYKILRSNIDINDHLHNLYYLDIAYETLPEDVYRANECNNIEIMYKKQITLSDQIVCLYTKEDEKNIVAIKSKDGKTLHSIINLY